ncbi:MAG TPA: EamA family transporter [Pseudonocardia sp.]
MLTNRVPPPVYFVVSALFHYLGPAFAVLLFRQVEVLGVAWLRIGAAAVVFAVWRRPWRLVRAAERSTRWLLLALGVLLAAMNVCFYLAIARLPLGTVGAIEFLGPVALAALGVRTRRNVAALLGVVAGVGLLTDVRLVAEPVGYLYAFANAAGFGLYAAVGHRLAADGASSGIDRLGVAMLIALVAVTPIGLGPAAEALTSPALLLAGFGVGICSSVIPYVTDQLAMARLPVATFSLMLALLPAVAVLIGVLVLHQLPSASELGGVALVIAAVALHQP